MVAAGRPGDRHASGQGELVLGLRGGADQPLPGEHGLQPPVELDPCPPRPGCLAHPGRQPPQQPPQEQEHPAAGGRQDQAENQQRRQPPPAQPVAADPIEDELPDSAADAAERVAPPCRVGEPFGRFLAPVEHGLIDGLALAGAVHLHDVIAPQRLEPRVQRASRAGQPRGAGGRPVAGSARRGVQAQPAAGGPLPVLLAVEQPVGDVLGIEIGLDPGVGVPLADLEEVAHPVELVAVITHHHPGGNALAAEHQRQGRGEVLAVSPGVMGDEVLDGVDGEVAVLGVEAVLELAGVAKPARQRPRPARPVLRRQPRLGNPLLGQGHQTGHGAAPLPLGHFEQGAGLDDLSHGCRRRERDLDPALKRAGAQLKAEAFPSFLLGPQQPLPAGVPAESARGPRIGERPDAEQLVAIQRLDGDLLPHHALAR